MDKKEFTVSEVIDSIGISSHTWVVFVLLAFAMIFDGYDFMIINSTNLFVAHTFWPDNPNPGALMGSLTTWGLLGMVLGGAVGGGGQRDGPAAGIPHQAADPDGEGTPHP